ncbi:MAG: competence/damage-inducible protein A [Planctomycetota bacterium]
MKRAWIISCGSELTWGAIVDTNAAWLARQLATLGVQAVRHVTVPDDTVAMHNVLLAAAADCDLIMVTGGLGPTADDLTRQALASASNSPLELDTDSLEQIRTYFLDRGREMPATNRVQAMIPRAGRALPNSCGTAPGIAMDIGGKPCFALPGVPFEMERMFADTVVPEIKENTSGTVVLDAILQCFGQGESDLGARLSDLMTPGRNPAVGTTAKLGVISVRITTSSADPDQARLLLEQDVREIRRRLGKLVFGTGDDTLSAAVGRLLVESGQTVSTAESCTGGLIGEMLTEEPGSSRYFLGGIVAYANEVKQALLGVDRDQIESHGAVSEPVAIAMAAGARERCDSDYAVSVTGIAGPSGGSPSKPVGLVYIGLATPDNVSAAKYQFGHTTPRDVIRMRAAHIALNLLRLEIERQMAARA